MYSDTTRSKALALRDSGSSWSSISRELGISRAAAREWFRRRDELHPPQPTDCQICEGAPVPDASYSALLGYYLGDGCISQKPRYFTLRVSCDEKYPAIVTDVARVISAVHPSRKVAYVPAEGCVVVQSNWKHWPCLFPQHGPGRKHERPIVLEDWQREIVEREPGPFLRGLFHSDGCRARNWTQRLVAGHMKRYDYPRWQFTNNSADIRELCCWALDLVDVPWRQSNWKTISVSRREAVRRLDELIGLKE